MKPVESLFSLISHATSSSQHRSHFTLTVTLSRLLVLHSFPWTFKEKRDCSQSSHRTFHRRWCHLSCGAYMAKFTVNVWRKSFPYFELLHMLVVVALSGLMVSALISGSRGPSLSLCCVLGQDTSLSKCFSLPRCTKGVAENLMPID